MRDLMERMRYLSGVSQDGSLDDVVLSEVKHTVDGRTKNVMTNPEDVLGAVLRNAGLNPRKNDVHEYESDVDAPNVDAIRVSYSILGGRGGAVSGKQKSIVITSLDPGTNKEKEIFRVAFPNAVYNSCRMQKTWWYDGEPSFKNPDGAKKAIDQAVSSASRFLSRYVSKAKKAKPSAGVGMLGKAMKANKKLKLGIDEGALQKLFAEIER